MPTKVKAASKSPVRDLSMLHDATVAEWDAIIATVKAYRTGSLAKLEAALKILVDAADGTSATADVDAGEAQRVVGTRLAKHVQLVLAVLDALDGKSSARLPDPASAAADDEPDEFLVQIAEKALGWTVDAAHPLNPAAVVRHVIDAVGDPGSESGAKRSARFWKECALRALGFNDDADAIDHGIKESPRGGLDMGSLQGALEKYIADLKAAKPAGTQVEPVTDARTEEILAALEKLTGKKRDALVAEVQDLKTRLSKKNGLGQEIRTLTGLAEDAAAYQKVAQWKTDAEKYATLNAMVKE